MTVGFYEIVKARYILALRKKEINTYVRNKTEKEREKLNELNQQKQKLVIKAIEGKITPQEREKIKDINGKIMKLRDTINNKTKKERKLISRLSRKIRNYDEVITGLVVENYQTEVVEPVKFALESESGEIVEVVAVRPAKGVKRGDLVCHG